MRSVAIGLMLQLTEEGMECLQDECDTHGMSLGGFVSDILLAVMNGCVRGIELGSVYERIDWTKMEKDGLCE